ncbi:hypothetical protein B0H19DRAFT_1074350 [Mycena capillaripes]|nr:hypothetical protein B0H19DRAFT_1074350 [Mycena capillaripes]
MSPAAGSMQSAAGRGVFAFVCIVRWACVRMAGVRTGAEAFVSRRGGGDGRGGTGNQRRGSGFAFVCTVRAHHTRTRTHLGGEQTLGRDRAARWIVAATACIIWGGTGGALVAYREQIAAGLRRGVRIGRALRSGARVVQEHSRRHCAGVARGVGVCVAQCQAHLCSHHAGAARRHSHRARACGGGWVPSGADEWISRRGFEAQVFRGAFEAAAGANVAAASGAARNLAALALKPQRRDRSWVVHQTCDNAPSIWERAAVEAATKGGEGRLKEARQRSRRWSICHTGGVQTSSTATFCLLSQQYDAHQRPAAFGVDSIAARTPPRALNAASWWPSRLRRRPDASSGGTT